MISTVSELRPQDCLHIYGGGIEHVLAARRRSASRAPLALQCCWNAAGHVHAGLSSDASTAARASGIAAGSPTRQLYYPHPVTERVGQARSDLEGEPSSTPPTPVSVTSWCALSRSRQLSEFGLASDKGAVSRPGDFQAPNPLSSTGGTRRAVLRLEPGKPRPASRYPVTALGPNAIRSIPLISAAVAPSSRIWPPWPAAITRAARLSTGTEVVAAAQLRLAGRDAHPHRQLQHALRGHCGIDGRRAGRRIPRTRRRRCA